MSAQSLSTPNRDQPAVKVEIEKGGISDDPTDFRISIEAETLEGEPVLKVTNEKTLEAYSIPYSLAIYLHDEFLAIDSTFLEKNREIEEGLSSKRKARYNPLEIEKDLMKLDSELDGSFQLKSFRGVETKSGLILKKDQDIVSGKPYVPFLSWHEEPIDYIPKGTHGWRLYLTGFADGMIGFAPWNDEEAIRKLVDSMRDVEALKVIASLVYPDTAKVTTVLATSESILDFLPARLDIKGREALIDLLENSPVLRYDKSAIKQSIPLIKALILADRQIAYGVTVPFFPIFKEPEAIRPEGFFAKYLKDKKNREEQLDFSTFGLEDATKQAERYSMQQRWETHLNLEACAAGYIRVYPLGDAQAPLSKGDAFDKRTIWLTKLSPSEWKQIFSATSVAKIQDDPDYPQIFHTFSNGILNIFSNGVPGLSP